MRHVIASAHLEHAQQRLAVVAQHGERDLHRAAERALEARDAEAVDDVLRQPEGHDLGALEREALVEEAVEVDGGYFLVVETPDPYATRHS